MRKKIGLALGSGGVKGIAHVGVIKQLIKNKIPIDFIAGTSIGAWVGAHYSLYEDIEKLEEFTVGKHREKLRVFFEPNFRGGIVGGNKINSLLKEWLKDKSFSNTKIPFQCVGTDIKTGKKKVFSRGKLATAVQASMSIPSLFKPIEINKRAYVDGGVADPVPVQELREMGADIVIAVNLDHYKNFNVSKNLNPPVIAVRTLDLMRHHLAQYSMQGADVIVDVKFSKIGLAVWADYFAKKNGHELVVVGQKAIKGKIKKIQSML